MHVRFVLIFGLLYSSILNAFIDTTAQEKSLLLNAYAEVYYCYDLYNPTHHTRPKFVYSHNRNNEVNLNLGFVKASFNQTSIRATIALMVGTYANANLASEPGTLKNIMESNIGIKISEKKNIWLDAGVFNSHIGFESPIGKDCWTLTRSMMADNSPYYETGVKVTYKDNSQKWLISGLVLNGWQRIQRLSGNTLPSFGHQITYQPNTRWLINSSSFIGSDTPDVVRKMRYYHNFYTQYVSLTKWSAIVGFDFGIQQQAKHSKNYVVWYSPLLILRYAVTPKINIALRGEYYSDKNQVIVNVGVPYTFNAYGYSVNVDYKIAQNALWRLEAKHLNSKDVVFTRDNVPVKNNYAFTTAIIVSF